MSTTATSTIISHTTLSNTDGNTVRLNLFYGSAIGFKHINLLEAMFNGLLLLQARDVLTIPEKHMADQRVAVNFLETGTQNALEGAVWIEDNMLMFWDGSSTFPLEQTMLREILRPFDFPVIELAEHIQMHVTEVGGRFVQLMEDLEGYYSGGETDIWALVEGGVLLAFEQVGNNKQELKAVFELGRTWKPEEFKENEEFEAVRQWAESV